MKKTVFGLAFLLFAVYVPASVFCQEWDRARLDTARSVTYLTTEEKDVILEMNMARSNPSRYAEMYIRPRLEWFGGPLGDDYYRRPGENVYIRQPGGRDSLVNAINAISRIQGRPPLSPSRGMSLAARDHTLDIGPSGMMSHTGSNRSTLRDRVQRYGRWEGGLGEAISYGYGTAREIVVQLLISQGHRDILMNGEHRYAGPSIGAHSVHSHMCTIKFAHRFTDRQP